MGKKDQAAIENRVYLFKDLAAGLLQSGASKPGTLHQSLADLAYVSAIVADEGETQAAKLRQSILKLASQKA